MPSQALLLSQAPLCQLNLTKVNDGLIDLDRYAKVLLGFLEEKLKTLMYIHFSLLWKFSDQIQNCTIQFKKVKYWTLTFQKIGQNFKSCLNSIVMIEANSWKNRRKLFQQSQRNRAVRWVKTSKNFSQPFSNFDIFYSLLYYYFSGILRTFHVAQMLLDSYYLFF